MLALVGAFACAGLLAPPASAASVDSKFQATLTRLIMKSDRPEVAKWTKEQRAIMAACIGEIVPQKKKQYILAGGDAEFDVRLDEVKAADKYAVERQINRTCLQRVNSTS